jgi:hypothetical protein
MRLWRSSSISAGSAWKMYTRANGFASGRGSGYVRASLAAASGVLLRAGDGSGCGIARDAGCWVNIARSFGRRTARPSFPSGAPGVDD